MEIKNEPGVAQMEYQSIDDIDSVTQLLKSDDFKDSMLKIKESLGVNPKPWFGLVEQNPEYQLVVKANELCSKIDNEVAIVHKFVQVNSLDKWRRPNKWPYKPNHSEIRLIENLSQFL